MPDLGILRPGHHRADRLVGDEAFVAAMLRVEVAWLRALAATGVATGRQADSVAAAAGTWTPDLGRLARDAENAGNPVVPLVAGLRGVVAEADPDAARLVHRGLTSQDVVDTALMLLARDALAAAVADLGPVADRLADLAERHRDSVMAGRTLTQHAVPVTFGLKAAQWLVQVLDAREQAAVTAAALPAQCGGAAGTLSLAARLAGGPAGDAAPLVAAFAHALDLRAPDLPWHTRRTPVTRVGDAAVTLCDALGAIGAEVALLGRPEIGEVSEGAGPGRGGSSTMPHKQNPVLSVLLRAGSLQAPLLGAQLHLAAAQSLEERPDGAWHTEWPALRQLLAHAVTAASQAAELLAGLQVHEPVMRRRAEEARGALLAERHGSAAAVPADADPAAYLGAAGAFVDAAIARHRNHREADAAPPEARQRAVPEAHDEEGPP